MQLTDTVQPSTDDSCEQDEAEMIRDFMSNFQVAPLNLAEPNSYGRLIMWLRVAAATHDALTLLTYSTAAFYLAHNSAVYPPDALAHIFGGDDQAISYMLSQFGGKPPLDDGFATAFADLSVSGRRAYASFPAQPPGETILGQRAAARLTAAKITVTAPLEAEAKKALDRAYSVARALRGSTAERLATRPTLRPQWIAVSAEDDSPDRPVNVASAPHPQNEIPVSVGGITVQTRFFIASPDDPTSPADPSPPGRALPVSEPITIPNGPTDRVVLFIHGHASSGEECTRLIPWLQAEGRAAGVRITVIAFDLPNNGYSSMFDHNLIAPGALTTYPGGFTDHSTPINVPVLDFIENAIVAFVDALETRAPFVDRCIGVIGGSLGGNMGLRLGRRPGRYPWLRNGIVAWSPAGVWDPMIQDEIKRKGPDHCRNKWDEAEQYHLPGNSSSRYNYFLETFKGVPFDASGNNVTETPDTRFGTAVPASGLGLALGLVTSGGFGAIFGAELGALAGMLLAPIIANMLGPAQATEWYRDDWTPCNGFPLLEGILGRQDVYNTFYRQWNFRVAGEQLIYSHVDRVNHYDSNSPWRYQLNTVRTLLASGEKDDFMWAHIFPATRTLSSLMSQTPGRSLFPADTGHSIHIERPRFFAREIIRFLIAEARVVDVVWKGKDDNLWHKRHVPSAWNDLESLAAGPLGSDPHPISPTAGVVDIFWKGTDSDLWHKWYVPSAGWSGPESLAAGPLVSDPYPTTPAPGVVDVFWKGTDGNLWHKWYVPNSGWGGPENLSGGPLGSDPHPTSPGSGVVDVFWKGQDNNLWHKWYIPNAGWNGPESLAAGPLGSDPHPISPAPGVVDVFWKGTDGDLWHKWYVPSSGWGGPESLGAGPLGSDPYPISPAPGVVDVFWKGTDGNLWHKWYVPSSGWGGPENLSGAPLGSDPRPTSSGNGVVDVFWKGQDGNLWHKSYIPNTGWSGPDSLAAGPLGSDPYPTSL